MIENILLFYLTRQEIPLHLFFARTLVGSLESQCNVAINVKTLSPKAPVLCLRFLAQYIVRHFFFRWSFNKLKRSEETFTIGMKNRNEEKNTSSKKKLNNQIIIIRKQEKIKGKNNENDNSNNNNGNDSFLLQKRLFQDRRRGFWIMSFIFFFNFTIGNWSTIFPIMHT